MIQALVALVPKPRVSFTRFHGVFALKSRWRQQETPARRGRGNREAKTATQLHVAVTWAQRLKRVFRIAIDICNHCGGAVLQIHRESGPSNGNL